MQGRLPRLESTSRWRLLVHGWQTQADLPRAVNTWLLSLALRKRARMLNGSGLFDTILARVKKSYVTHPSCSFNLCFLTREYLALAWHQEATLTTVFVQKD